MSLYAKELYEALVNDAAAKVIGGGSLTPKLRLLMVDRARNVASWTAPHAGVLRTTARKDQEAKDWLREEQGRLERVIADAPLVVRNAEVDRLRASIEHAMMNLPPGTDAHTILADAVGGTGHVEPKCCKERDRLRAALRGEHEMAIQAHVRAEYGEHGREDDLEQAKKCLRAVGRVLGVLAEGE